MELKVGDVVRLKTGGPRMTVNQVGITRIDGYGSEKLPPVIEAVWFTNRLTESGNPIPHEWEGPHHGEFGADALDKVEA